MSRHPQRVGAHSVLAAPRAQVKPTTRDPIPDPEMGNQRLMSALSSVVSSEASPPCSSSSYSRYVFSVADADGHVSTARRTCLAQHRRRPRGEPVSLTGVDGTRLRRWTCSAPGRNRRVVGRVKSTCIMPTMIPPEATSRNPTSADTLRRPHRRASPAHVRATRARP